MNTIYVAALVLGLASNFHCIGMCGPIAMAIPLDRSSNFRLISGILQYNLGRILVYGLLGAIIGIFGLSIQTIGFLQWMSIIIGITLIVYAWRKYLANLLPSIRLSFSVNQYINKSIGKIIRSKSPFKLLGLGALNGLLPCGMVFAALLNALVAGNSFNSAVAMMIFGAGTLPAMIAVAYLANKMGAKLRIKMNKAVPYLLTVVGLLIVLRGMNLNIPFISPRVSIQQTTEQDPEVKMDCCHSTSCEE